MMNFGFSVQSANCLFTVSVALPNSDVYEMLSIHVTYGF